MLVASSLREATRALADEHAPAVLCAHCGAEVAPARVSSVGLARCAGCQRFLDLDPLLPPRPVPPPPEEIALPPPARPPEHAAPLLLRRDAPFPMPEGATVEDQLERLELKVPDSIGRNIVAPLFGLVALGAGVNLALSSKVSVELGATTIAIAAVCGLAAWAGAQSRRYFRADAHGLSTGSAPIPWLRGPGIRVPRLTELFVERNWTQADKHRYRFIWELYARTDRGEKVAVLEGGLDPILVHWLGQRLAQRLGAKLTPAADPEPSDGVAR